MSDQFEIPPSLQALEDQLNAAAAELDRTIEDVQQQSFDRGPQVTQDDLRAISRYAHSRDAPPELRELQRRIEQGEFTWDDVLAGNLMEDEGVRSALSANLDSLVEVKERVDAGEDIDDVIAEGPRSDDEDDDPRSRRGR